MKARQIHLMELDCGIYLTQFLMGIFMVVIWSKEMICRPKILVIREFYSFLPTLHNQEKNTPYLDLTT